MSKKTYFWRVIWSLSMHRESVGLFSCTNTSLSMYKYVRLFWHIWQICLAHLSCTNTNFWALLTVYTYYIYVLHMYMRKETHKRNPQNKPTKETHKRDLTVSVRKTVSRSLLKVSFPFIYTYYIYARIFISKKTSKKTSWQSKNERQCEGLFYRSLFIYMHVTFDIFGVPQVRSRASRSRI